MSFEELIMNEKIKNLGQIFTPDWIVNLILDRLEYNGSKILGKYILEPGCGDGNFLFQIVTRYIKSARASNYNKEKIKKDLEKYIYGIEIDDLAYKSCLNRLDKLSRIHSIIGVKWNIKHADILDINFNNLPKFDFVVGNPPCVRIHNLDKRKIKEIKTRFDFCRSGIIDLFLVFFEIGILSLNQSKGRLGFITPNSFIHNSTYVNFRKFLSDRGLIKEVINFKENIVFDSASTYNAVTILDTGRTGKIIDYYEYQVGKINYIDRIDLTKQDLKKWNFASNEDTKFLEKLKQYKNKISDFATVQYGFATLSDGIYTIKDNNIFQCFEGEDQILYPLVKASRYDGREAPWKIIYPYLKKGNKWEPVLESELKNRFPRIFSYLLSKKELLERRSVDKKNRFWYEYGRSQGVQTMHNKKLVISPILKDKVKVFKVDENVMVYSGIYLFIKEGSKYNLDDFIKIIGSNDFLKYARIVGKDMRGGYKNINTKAIKDYPVF